MRCAVGGRIVRSIAVAIGVVVAGAACSDSRDSSWAAKANALCAAFTERWTLDVTSKPADLVRGPTLVELRTLVGELQAVPGADATARPAVDGLVAAITETESRDAPNDLRWLSHLEETGAVTCWQMFQGTSPIDP